MMAIHSAQRARMSEATGISFPHPQDTVSRTAGTAKPGR